MGVDRSTIIIRRYGYEEPHYTQLEFIISNGEFSASVILYCSPEDIKEIGESLSVFPKKIGDEYRYVHGSEKPEDRSYRYFLMRAYTINNRGSCALQFQINLNVEEPGEGRAVFSLLAEPGAINQLGKLLITFSKLQHKEIQWSNRTQKIFEEHQPEKSE